MRDLTKVSNIILSLGIALGSIAILFTFLTVSESVTFESLESEDEQGNPIYNQIRFFPGWKKDVWVMRQAQTGYHSQKSDWDRLAIEVDKTQKPYVATFYQLASGALELDSNPSIVPFKARCMACHANGPRAVRAKIDSKKVPLQISEQLRLTILNLRIKSYGLITNKPAKSFVEGAVFKSKLDVMSQPLGLKSCLKCHSDTGMRAPLLLEHLGTAHFMLDRGLMPPFPYKADPGELKYLKKLMRIDEGV